jgi:hypothetical protein
MEITTDEQIRNEPRAKALALSALDRADQLVEQYWEAIVRVALLLMEKKALTGDEVAEILNDTYSSRDRVGSIYGASGLATDGTAP